MWSTFETNVSTMCLAVLTSEVSLFNSSEVLLHVRCGDALKRSSSPKSFHAAIAPIHKTAKLMTTMTPIWLEERVLKVSQNHPWK